MLGAGEGELVEGLGARPDPLKCARVEDRALGWPLSRAEVVDPVVSLHSCPHAGRSARGSVGSFSSGSFSLALVVLPDFSGSSPEPSSCSTLCRSMNMIG